MGVVSHEGTHFCGTVWLAIFFAMRFAQLSPTMDSMYPVAGLGEDARWVKLIVLSIDHTKSNSRAVCDLYCGRWDIELI
jgi:hypothetical protein